MQTLTAHLSIRFDLSVFRWLLANFYLQTNKTYGFTIKNSLEATKTTNIKNLNKNNIFMKIIKDIKERKERKKRKKEKKE